MPNNFDNTWEIVKESCRLSVFVFTLTTSSTFVTFFTPTLFFIYFILLFYFIFFFQPKLVHKLVMNKRVSSVMFWRSL